MLSDVGTIIDLSDDEWDFVADLFDPDGRRGTPAQHPRRRMVEAMLYLARTGCQWRAGQEARRPGGEPARRPGQRAGQEARGRAESRPGGPEAGRRAGQEARAESRPGGPR